VHSCRLAPGVLHLCDRWSDTTCVMFRTTSRLSMAVAVIAVVMMIAACGASSPGASHSGGHRTQPQAQKLQAMLRFADCMRSHGVPNLPDPTSSPHDFKSAFANPSPAVHSASAVCQHLLPAGAQHRQNPAQSQRQIAAHLAFARCLRSHGFPNFPDPDASGELTHEMLANAGIDLHQPAVLQAGDACVSVTHGVITTAAVARFVAGH
jgi:hypothetical protein